MRHSADFLQSLRWRCTWCLLALALFVAGCTRPPPEQAVRAQLQALQAAIDVRDSDAVARFNLLATGGAGGLLPESGQAYRVETGWRLVDGEWRLRSASWKAAL